MKPLELLGALQATDKKPPNRPETLASTSVEGEPGVEDVAALESALSIARSQAPSAVAFLLGFVFGFVSFHESLGVEAS